MVHGESKNIKVIVRVRPYNRRELEQNQRSIIKVMDTKTILFDPDEDDDEFFFQGIKQNYRDITKKLNKKLSMEFDRVYDTGCTNDDIFEECTSPLVDSVLDGYNCSVFVYGATGAGKTFTMLGSDDCRGLSYLTMQDLFDKMDKMAETRKFDIGVSYLEVYNEQVMNLLTKSGPLKLREDSNGVVVSGLVLKPIYSADELLEMLAHGNSNRTQHPTDANAESSRSHAVFQVHIRMTEKKTGQKRTVKLSMIDLAGSERAASTKGMGVRFKEGASINKSLLALGNCINKLADGSKHIPYRDSNLTRILKDSLGGNCQTLMIANASMSSLTYEDTYNTLKYASRAKKIRTTLRKNAMKSNMPKDFYVKKVNEQMDELDKMRDTIKALEAKLANIPKESSKAFDETELKFWYRKIDAVYSALIKAQEYYFGMQSKEKILKFRTKLKENAEAGKNILTLDNGRINEDIAKYEASIDRFGKQIERQQEDLIRWRKKYQESFKDLEKLKGEIKEDKNCSLLEIYLRSKEAEVRNSKQNIKSNHIAQINTLYHVDSENLRKAFLLSCEILQRNYLILKSDNAVDADLQDKLKRLRSIMNGHRIKFEDQNEGKESDEDLELSIEYDPQSSVEIHLNGKRLLSSSDEESSFRVKRNKQLVFNDVSDLGIDMMDDDSVFKHPSTVINNLNDTQTLSVNDPNSTFQLSAPNVDKNELVKSILSEHNSSTSNRSQIRNVLLKSNITRENILKTVASGIQKESKKFSPNRVRKSPRAPTLTNRALTSTANFLRRQKTKTATTATEPGIVRINRTASLRIKK